MALLRKPSEIPKDAINLNENEALRLQWKIISNWNNKKEVWALQHGPSVLAGVSALSAVLINSHYRNRFKLGNAGRFSSYLPIVVIPSACGLIFHKYFVQSDVILRPMRECPVCLQLRAATIQCGFGTLYPLILAPTAGFIFATRNFTIRLPLVSEKPLEVLQMVRRFTKPLVPVLSALLAVNGIAALYLTYKQLEQSLLLQIELRKLEQLADEERRLKNSTDVISI